MKEIKKIETKQKKSMFIELLAQYNYNNEPHIIYTYIRMFQYELYVVYKTCILVIKKNQITFS